MGQRKKSQEKLEFFETDEKKKNYMPIFSRYNKSSAQRK